MDQYDRIMTAQKRHELFQACQDLRLPVSSNDSIETMELYIKAAYDEFENQKNQSSSYDNPEFKLDDDLNVSIGHSKFRTFLGKVIPFF